jgi:hypothetical protein
VKLRIRNTGEGKGCTDVFTQITNEQGERLDWVMGWRIEAVQVERPPFVPALVIHLSTILDEVDLCAEWPEAERAAVETMIAYWRKRLDTIEAQIGAKVLA